MKYTVNGYEMKYQSDGDYYFLYVNLLMFIKNIINRDYLIYTEVIHKQKELL